MRKKFTSETKLKAVLCILRGQESMVQIARDIGCHPTLLKDWKARFNEQAPALFDKLGNKSDEKRQVEQLQRLIGKQTIQIDFLEKVSESLDSA
jgi:transposase-like protein